MQNLSDSVDSIADCVESAVDFAAAAAAVAKHDASGALQEMLDLLLLPPGVKKLDKLVKRKKFYCVII